MNRREFVFSGLCAGALGPVAAATPDGEFSFLQATDLHTTENPDIERGALQMKDKFMGRCFVDEINALGAKDRSVAFVALTGDLTSGVSMDPACWAFAERKWRHYRKYVADRLTVPFRQLLGNNDCASVPYKKAFPEQELFWSFERGGILFVGLHGYNCWKTENTNHAGIRYDERQLEWLGRIVRATSARSLVVFTHEPLVCDDSHVARAQLAAIVSGFRGEETWNVAGHEHRNHVAAFALGGKRVRSVETMTPVGGWKVGKGCFRRFLCADGLVVGSRLHWVAADGTPLEVTDDVAVRNPKPAVLLEDSFPKDALAVRLAGRDPFTLCPQSRRVEDRIADYHVAPRGVLRFDVADALGGREVGSVVLRTSAGLTRQPLPQPDSSGRRWAEFANDSPRGIKFFGYALCP